MKEISRIVIGLVALRLMRNGETRWYEIFESDKTNGQDENEWKRINPTRLHQLSFDARVYDWLNQHKNFKDNVLEFPKNANNERVEQTKRKKAAM
jgi:predicted nucleotidyltransferase